MATGQFNRATSGAQIDAARIDEGLRSYMLGIYNYMGLGLAVSALVALAVATIDPLAQALVFSPARWLFVLAPLGILLFMSFKMQTMSVGTMKTLYWVLTAAMGVSMAVLLFAYTPSSVVKTFFATAAAFGAMSLWGYTAKKSLSGVGTFCMMGLVGLIVAMVVNIFLQSPMMHFIIAGAGVVIFAGLTAWDTQRLKEAYAENMAHEDMSKLQVMGAVGLYLNFINLFQFLLMFLGDRE